MACQNQPPQNAIANTPKAVSLHWQQLVNTNQFVEAKKWSTQNAKEWLDWIEQMILPDSSAIIQPPLFIEGDCVEKGNQATCVYLMEDGGELYQDSFFMLKLNGQWLVDLPEESFEADPEVDKLMNELEEYLKEEEAQEK